MKFTITTSSSKVSVGGNIGVQIADDIPFTNDDFDYLTSDQDGTMGNVIAGSPGEAGKDEKDADDATVTSIQFNNTPHGATDGKFVITGTYWTLTLDAITGETR
ncbi:hypothetical protein ACUSIJ_02690 [Pseudochelatococcus sp. B33]